MTIFKKGSHIHIVQHTKEERNKGLRLRTAATVGLLANLVARVEQRGEEITITHHVEGLYGRVNLLVISDLLQSSRLLSRKDEKWSHDIFVHALHANTWWAVLKGARDLACHDSSEGAQVQQAVMKLLMRELRCTSCKAVQELIISLNDMIHE